jgi:hypothetical protein
MARLRAVRRIGMIALVAGLMAACASGSRGGTVIYVIAADAPQLAGAWQGFMTGPSGGGIEAILNVRPDGTYTVQGGSLTSQGRAEPRDGHIQFVSSSTTGGMQVGERTGSAVLIDRGSSWGLVGSGRAPAGPYNFDFNKAK